MTYIISFRRTFKVNVQKKMFYSHILQRTFYLEVSVHALRTIRKYGIYILVRLFKIRFT